MGLELERVAALPQSERWDQVPGLRFLLRGKLTAAELKTPGRAPVTDTLSRSPCTGAGSPGGQTVHGKPP